MTSLVISLALALLAVLLPLASDGLSWQGATAVAILALLLWPLVAIMRRLVGWVHRIITGPREP
ncbi:MAG: hypothetical protein KatS3mg124_1830 [Porticoccaceae bacterium]|nr:MAG: hypothetical protein KatS3mg124_1830 [Porticoccaceae bacterium]